MALFFETGGVGWEKDDELVFVVCEVFGRGRCLGNSWKGDLEFEEEVCVGKGELVDICS